MTISIIISIIVLILIFGIALKLFHKVLSAVLLTIAFIIIATLATGFFLYQDINDLRTNFASSENMFLLASNDTLVSGVTASFDDIGNGINESITYLSDDDLSTYQDYYVDDEYDKILTEDLYKLIIFDTDYFNRTIKERVALTSEIELSKKQVMKLLLEDDSFSTFIDITYESIYEGSEQFEAVARPIVEDTLREQFKDKFNIRAEDDFQSFIFLTVVGKTMTDKKAGSIITLTQQFKKGNLAIYPKTFFFRIVSWIPLDIVDSLLAKAVSSVKEKSPVEFPE